MARAVRRLHPVACPECGSTRVGRIGVNQFYCGDCCLELQVRRTHVELYAVDEEGNLRLVGRRPLRGRGMVPPAASQTSRGKGVATWNGVSSGAAF